MSTTQGAELVALADRLDKATSGGSFTEVCISAQMATKALRQIAAALRSPGPLAGEPSEWRPIEAAPKGRKLIAGYPNRLGKWRTVMACYYDDETLPMHDSYMGDKEFADAGWYEVCENDDEAIHLTETEPTHWMELPKAPARVSIDIREDA